MHYKATQELTEGVKKGSDHQLTSIDTAITI